MNGNKQKLYLQLRYAYILGKTGQSDLTRDFLNAGGTIVEMMQAHQEAKTMKLTEVPAPSPEELAKIMRIRS